MKRPLPSHLRLLLLWLAFIAWLPVSRPADAQSDNAATYYQRAIDTLNKANFSDAQWEQFFAYQSGGGGQPPAQVDMMLRQLQPVLDLTRRASSRGYSDFGLDYSQGIGLLLPHLGKMRTIAKIMDADTKVRLHNGDTVGAARNLAAVTRMGGHASEDRTLISALVGNAVYAVADDGMQYGFDRGLFNEADAAAMLAATTDLRADDPFQMVESIMMEGDVFIGWIKDELNKENGAQQLAETLGAFGEDADAYLEVFQSEDIEGQFAKIDGVMNEVVEIFSMDDHDAARQRLADIEAKVVAGEYGQIAQVLLPAYGKVYERMLEAEQQVAERRTMLEQFVRGEIKRSDALNAAILYVQAMDDWLALDASHRQRVRRYVRERGMISDELTTTLREAQPIIDTLRQASLLERCDFDTVRGTRQSTALCERYVIGMRELWDLLITDGVAEARTDAIDTATDRIAISLRMVPHLAADHTLAGAVTCQYAFNQTAALLVELLDADRLSDEHLSRLRPAVLAIERRDPFGAIDTIVALREMSVARLVSRQMADTPADQLERVRAEAQELYNAWTGDHYLYVRAAQEHAEQQQRVLGADELVGSVHDELTIERMDGIFSMDALEQIQREGGFVLSLIEQGEADIFAGADVPLLTNYRDNRLRARNDVRTIHSVLRLSGSSDGDADAD